MRGGARVCGLALPCWDGRAGVRLEVRPLSVLPLLLLLLLPGERYDGEWREGHEDGIGVFTWRDGSTYEGARRATGGPAAGFLCATSRGV